MRRLLVLGCSQRKRTDAGLLPAVDRYDGPAFRVLRRYRAERADAGLAAVVLSAEFGLIPIDEPIPNYDRRMTSSRAVEIAPVVNESLAGLPRKLCLDPDRSAYLAVLGRQYLDVLAACRCPLAETLLGRNADGGIGAKSAVLAQWLRRGDAPEPVGRGGEPVVGEDEPVVVRLRGRALALTRAEVVERAIAERDGCRTEPAVWRARLVDRWVSPKWLVSIATGLPVSAFGAADARRILERLGFEVRRS